jgi:hypothetical protein
MKVDICYVISHGFAARMLLQTGLIHQLADAGKKVAIISSDAKDANLSAFRERDNILLFESEEKIRMWNDNYLFKRKYYLEDIKENPALWEKHIYNIFYSPSKHPWRRIRPLYYYLIYVLAKYFPQIRENFIQHEHKYLKSGKVEALIDQIQPKLVVATYPVNFLEAQVLYAARQANIPTLIHLLSWDNITSKGRFPMSADYFIVWGEVMYRELKDYYDVPDERIYTCGVPHFDNHIWIKEAPNYEQILTELGLQTDKPYLFCALSAPRFAPKEIDIVENLAQSILDNEFGKDLQLIIRPHPQNVQGFMADQSWLKRLKKLENDRIAVDYPRLVKSQLRWSMQKDDMDRLSNLLAGCSICINSGSTVSIDALMLHKPVILTSFDGNFKLSYWKSARRLVDYTHLKKFVALGGARVVRSFGEFHQAILAYLQQPDLDVEKKRNALEKECFSDDGKSTARVLEAMKDILSTIDDTSFVSNSPNQ